MRRGYITVVNALHGHFWTVGPYLRHVVLPPAVPPSFHWQTTVPDPRVGDVRLSGRMRQPPGAQDLLVAVHGLGGFSGSHYMIEAARAAEQAGLACLRLNLRGADRRGEDFYHAGLTDDLHAALSAAELASYRRIHLLGFSLGGHLALRYATESGDPRVTSVAAVCPPLDLAKTAQSIDADRPGVYRRHVLRGLKDMYRRVAARQPEIAVPLSEAERIRTFRQWDDRIVAPWHGFAGAEDYWRRASVAPRLAWVRCPALLVAARHDPMVRQHTLDEALAQAPEVRTVWLQQGGHVGFPPRADLALGPEGTVCEQITAWLMRPA
jgi:hypothetical protein